jgi:hypothetical protein
VSRRRGGAGALVPGTIVWGIALGVVVRPARAESAPRICVVGPSGNHIVARVISELTSSGFLVTTSSTTAPGPPAYHDDCDAMARVVAKTGIEVWSVDHRARTASELETFPAARPDDPDGAEGPVRAAELLRARFLPVASTPPAPPAAPMDAPAPAVTLAPAPSGPSSTPPTGPPQTFASARFGLDAGGIVFVSPGGVPPSTSLLVMPRWFVTRRLIVHAAIGVPLAPPEVSAREGHADVTEWLIDAALDWRLLPDRREWGFDVGVGVGACEVRTQGIANPSYVSSTGDAWTWVPMLEALASRTLWSPHVRLELIALLGAAWPEVRIRFSGQDVASWGRPLVGAALTLQTDVF